jgi:hypothetical protein
MQVFSAWGFDFKWYGTHNNVSPEEQLLEQEIDRMMKEVDEFKLEFKILAKATKQFVSSIEGCLSLFLSV